MDESSPGVPDPGAASSGWSHLGSGRYRRPGLTIAGTGTVIPLPFFSVREVRRQCVAVGWSFAARR